LFPSGEPDTPGPSRIVFGQNFLLDTPDIIHDRQYVRNLKALLSTARIARFRDPVSAYRAGIVDGSPASRFLGVDAALLLAALDGGDEGAISNLEVEGSRNGEGKRSADRVGVFFGRTRGAVFTKLALTVYLRAIEGVEAVWLSWLPRKRMPFWVRRGFGIRSAVRPGSIAEHIDAVRSCRFIVTDTYHLSLIAWSHGVPAICIGKGAQHFRSTLHDKKKEIFYAANFIDELYLFAEKGLSNIFDGSVRRALRLAQDEEFSALRYFTWVA